MTEFNCAEGGKRQAFLQFLVFTRNRLHSSSLSDEQRNLRASDRGVCGTVRVGHTLVFS